MRPLSRGCLRSLGAVVILLGGPTQAGESLPFSYMTLNGVHDVAISIEDLERDLEVYGLTQHRIRALVEPSLRADGLNVITSGAALTTPNAGLLRVGIISNYDANGFYHLSVKLEFRAKVPLGNAAGGFVSQAVWTDAHNAVILASEVDKIDPLVIDAMKKFSADYRAQNGVPGH